MHHSVASYSLTAPRPLAGTTHCAYPQMNEWPGWLVTYRDK